MQCPAPADVVAARKGADPLVGALFMAMVFLWLPIHKADRSPLAAAVVVAGARELSADRHRAGPAHSSRRADTYAEASANPLQVLPLYDSCRHTEVRMTCIQGGH